MTPAAPEERAAMTPVRSSALHDEDFDAIAVEPRAFERSRRRLPWIRLGLSSAATVALLAYMAPPPGLPPLRPADLAVPPPPLLLAPPPRWTHLDRPDIALGIDAPGFAGLATVHAARRHAGGAREDTLAFGTFRDDGAHLQVSLVRDEEEAVRRSFFVDLARRAADAGLAVVRTEQATMMTTKFGVLEAADIVLEDGRSRGCLAFRLPDPEGSVRLFGWHCGAGKSRAALACVIDGLTLLDDGGDFRLRDAFTAAATRRDPACGPRVPAASGPVASGPLTNAAPGPVPPPRPSRL